jgi:mono/diheme cytochrome c family protein
MKFPLNIPWMALPLALLLVACGGGGGGSSTDVVAAADVGAEAEASPAAVTWYSAASPLIDRYCAACHSEGGVAPFPLETYEQVRNKRSALVYVLESQTMPPQGYADLSASEARLLLDWLNAGAPRGDESQAPLRQLAQGLSYHADARAIIEEKCVSCHQQGGIAPFPLDDYDKVRAVSAAAAFAIDNGTMPPWHPTEGYTSFADSRALTPQQKYILLNWLQGDMALGSPGDYLAPPQKSVKGAEDYNLQLALPQAYTPTLRPDDHRCFAIEWPLGEFAYVTNVDVIPDQVDEVHHVIVSIAEPEDAATYYAANGEDGRPGWHCLGMGGVDGAPLPRQIGGWVPGAGRELSPEGTGIGVKPGSVMIVQMHYNTLVAEPKPDQSTILVETAAEVELPSSAFLLPNPAWLAPGGMPIAAGDPDAHHEMTFPGNILALVRGAPAGIRVNQPWVMHNGFIHMHTRGKSGRITLLRKNGTEQVLLDIRDWDFNWQSTYRFERELLVEPGDRIKLECNWDNTQANQDIVNGVQQTPKYIEWGDGTGDEMCLLSVLMTPPREGYDYSYAPTVHIEIPHYRQQFVAGELMPLRLLLNNFTLHDPGLHDHSDPVEHSGSNHATDTDDHSQVFSGHYHVYLDTDDDSAEHLTAWDSSYYYQLPEAIEPGVHTLRVSLRGPDHHPLAVEHEVEFEIVERTSTTSVSLVDVNEWVEQPEAEDSQADHRPADVECPNNSWYSEDGALEVETGYCNYLSLGQPSLTGLQAGDTLHLVLWHADLAFEQPASAHVAVSIAGKLVWETEVAIPAQANIFDVRVPLDFDAPAGSTVEYHLHNHGYNSWTLLQLEVER